MEIRSILGEVFWQSLDGIVVTDRDTVVTEVNPAYEVITGYSRAELLGQKTNIIRSGVNPIRLFEEMWEALNTRGKWVGELINRRKDGQLWHSYLSITRVLDEHGQVGAYVGIARDITGRKEMERQLRHHLMEIEAAREMADATAGRLQAILESVGEAIMMMDTHGECVTANHRIGSVLGLTAEDVTGRSVHELRMLSSRIFRGAGALEWNQPPGGGPPVEIGTAVVETREDTPRVFHEFSAPVQDESGRVMGRIFVYRDITKETEVDRMKSEFIATVSHELRTPMTSIKGSLGLLLGGMVGEVPGEARELLTIAMNNTDRLIRLINDILDISRIEAGKMEIRKAPTSVAEAVRRAVRDLQGFAEQRKIGVVTVLPGEMPRAVADADRLQQVLVNLLSNAIKFSEPGATVSVTGGCDAAEVWVRV
ncbi:MAG TPA: PAS domain S-box protein, partial [Symbiobacteriaceae bacterium]|nr:PAS domain S-box protein [Symbiobacteriaceae bacterium]